MLEKLSGLPQGVEGVRAVGKVSKADYESVVVPMLDAFQAEGRRVRFLYELGGDFDGFTPGGAWEDAKLGLRTRLFDGLAVVSDIRWIRESTRLIGLFVPCPIGIYHNAERSKAIDWLAALPETVAAPHRLIPESGVIVFEVKEALKSQDFDALSATADGWIQAHGSLQGIVVHAREFPGWEDLPSVVRHVRFVKDHHKKIKRIAVAGNGRIAELAPKLAELFVKADMRSFEYDELDKAITWAAGTTQPSTAPSKPPKTIERHV